MNILLPTDSFPPNCGGSGWSTYELARGLMERGHKVVVVKVVAGSDGCALYFSRAPIPWVRDGVGPAPANRQLRHDGAMRHIGLYAYRVRALREITRLPPSRLEVIEKLEQLRALENGLRIVVAPCIVEPGPGIDTEADLAAARARLRKRVPGS